MALEPIPMPAPYGGQNTRIPAFALESPQCEKLLNFNINEAGATLRKGDALTSSRAQTATASIPRGFGVLESTGIGYYWLSDPVAARTHFYSYTGTLIGDSATVNSPLYRSVYFNNYLMLMTPSADAPGYKWDGASFSALAYTGTSLAPYGGAVYKNRNYVIQYQTTDYWYSEIDAVAGALTRVSMGSVISKFGWLADIGVITLADNVSAVPVICFIYTTGEVLFYGGNYPGSPTWGLLGRADIGRPFYGGTNISYGGDYLVITETGLFSLKDEFLKGSNGARVTLDENVSKEWIAAGATVTTQGQKDCVQGVWDKKNQRLIICFPSYLDTDGVTEIDGAIFFIFNTSIPGWTIHISSSVDEGILNAGGILGLAVIDKNVYFLGANVTGNRIGVFQKEGRTGSSIFQDVNASSTAISYDYEIKSAAVKNGRAYVQKAEGMDVIVESDLYTETNYTFIRDFGVGTTTAQKIPAQPSGMQKPFVNMGIEGSYIQSRIYGTTAVNKTIGYKLYGTNVWIDQGRSPR